MSSARFFLSAAQERTKVKERGKGGGGGVWTEEERGAPRRTEQIERASERASEQFEFRVRGCRAAAAGQRETDADRGGHGETREGERDNRGRYDGWYAAMVERRRHARPELHGRARRRQTDRQAPEGNHEKVQWRKR